MQTTRRTFLGSTFVAPFVGVPEPDPREVFWAFREHSIPVTIDRCADTARNAWVDKFLDGYQRGATARVREALGQPLFTPQVQLELLNIRTPFTPANGDGLGEDDYDGWD